MWGALAKLEGELPAGLVIESDEAIDLVREELCDAGRVTPGGAGAGVQVLGVVEARARTFEHLFVMGLNRDVFPRQVREDWLLPDRLRGALVPVLPDIPLKRTGHDEERYLFAQLLAAAPRVTILWTECDDDGKATPASPLGERLFAGGVAEAPLLRDLYAEGGVGDRSPRPAHEHAVLAGLTGERQSFAAVVPAALATQTVDAVEARAVATARAAVLAELEPDRRTAECRRRATLPGPYFGLVGTGLSSTAELPVTTLEGFARCPWQTFLGRVLRLEPVPDAGGDLPALSGPLLGNVVHRTLERVAGPTAEDAPRSLADVSASRSRPIVWPEGAELAGLVAAVAEEVLQDEGLALPLLVRSLAERVRPYIDACHAADLAGEGPVEVAGAEIEGTAEVIDAAGRARRVSFRADRADAAGDALVLTDYKTGKGFSEAALEKNKRKPLLAAISGGRWLQAAAYAAAGGEVAAGRYLFLKPELDDRARVFVAPGDGDVLDAFRRATVELLALHDLGAFFPRLLEADGKKPNPACGYCPFREACVIGDSGARRRLLAWVPAGGDDAAVAAAARVWWLGKTDGEGEDTA